jgi:hypothetical protein
MASRDQPADGWTVDLGHQPPRIVEGQPEGPYADGFEIIRWASVIPSRITARPQLAGAACGRR